jgi:hypothetical protein
MPFVSANERFSTSSSKISISLWDEDDPYISNSLIFLLLIFKKACLQKSIILST